MGYSSSQANEMLMGLPSAMAKTAVTMAKKAKMGLGEWIDKKIIENALPKYGMDEAYPGELSGLKPISTEGSNTFLPFVKTEEGYKPKLPGLAADAYNTFIAPNRSMTDPNFNAPKEGVNMGLNLMGMGTAFGKVPEGALAMGAIRKDIVPPVNVVKSIKPKPIKAPASDVGFYSPVEKAALNLNRNQGSGQSFLNDLKKGENVKKDELTYTELEDWLKTKPNLTKQEVQDYIANNKLDIQESYLDDSENIWSTTGINNTQYSEWQLPNGENYREILLKLPSSPMEIRKAAEKYYTALVRRKGEPEWSQLSPARQQEMEINTKDGIYSPDYFSSHWEDTNVLAHIRTNQRLDVNGKKTTLIEEIQSDLHQAGRDKGYGKNGVPDAPFKEDWYKLALKRAIKEAVENGSDSISLTTGSRQAERYNLGGEGMKKYYDEIYPAFLNKFGKKYGVKVEDNIIDIGKPEKIYTLPITPQMREDVLKGQPLTDKNEQDKNQYYA